MQSIILSPTAKNTAGGRPKTLGGLEYVKGGVKIFLGYDEETGRKVLVDILILEQIFSFLQGDYQLNFAITKTRKNPFKIRLNHFV